MNTCKLRGRRKQKERDTKFAPGYMNWEADAFQKFTWLSETRANHLQVRLDSVGSVFLFKMDDELL